MNDSNHSIHLEVLTWMSRPMNQTYFECYEFDVNIVLTLIVLIFINQYCSEFILLTHMYSKYNECLWVSKKQFISDLWYPLISLFSALAYKSCDIFINRMKSLWISFLWLIKDFKSVVLLNIRRRVWYFFENIPLIMNFNYIILYNNIALTVRLG